jgi:hypothetical protein
VANLFELTKRRRRAQEFADRFREGATESEREFFDRYYQEPSASPILQRGELQRQLEEGDALRRSLMARGMNAMQAEDAAARAEQQRMDERDRLAQDIALTRGPGGIKGEGPGSYAEYTTRGTDTGGAAEFLRSQGMPVPARPDSLSLDDFAKQRAIEMQMAQSRARLKVEEAKAKLPEVVANSQLQERAARNLDEQLQILLSLPTVSQGDSRSAEIERQRIQAETTIDNVLRALGKGSRTSGAMGLGQNPAGFVDAQVEQAMQGAPQQMQGEAGNTYYLRPTQVESREFN